MRMIACLSPVSGGTLRVLGLDPMREGSHIRSRIGLVPQEDTLDLELTVRTTSILYGRYFGLPKKVLRERVDQLLEFARLTERANDRVDPLSGGMRRRLTIARALVSSPELVILDEPTTGLDPQARHLLWDRLYRLKREGVTLVITTHYMDEAEQLCDRLVVMDSGRIAAVGSPQELIERWSTREVVELRFGPRATRPTARRWPIWPSGSRCCPTGCSSTPTTGDATLDEVRSRGKSPIAALVRRSTLEDVYLHLTGRSLVD